MSIPRLFDVVVVGAGPAGLCAAVQSARAGAQTLLVEKSGIMGGTTVLNEVNFPGLFHAWGRQIIAGIGWELVSRTVEELGEKMPDFSQFRNRPHHRNQILVNTAVYAALADEIVLESGAQPRLHTMVAEACYLENRWRIELCGKEGLETLEASTVIDCTGDANVVALAKLPLHRNQHLQPGTLVMEATGYDFDRLDLKFLENEFIKAVESGELRRSDFQADKNPVASFLYGRGRNSMHVTGINGATSAGKTEAEFAARAAMLRIQRFLRRQSGLENFRIAHLSVECGIRETCTIDAEYRITAKDYIEGKCWHDSYCYSFYPIDIHATDGIGIDTRPLREGVFPTIPLRAMLPKGSSHLLVAGRCVAGDQAANSAYRVQASCMAMGQVAGAAAALASMSGIDIRQVAPLDICSLLTRHGAIVPIVEPNYISQVIECN